MKTGQGKGTSMVDHVDNVSLDEHARACVRQCLACHASCLETVSFCLLRAGAHAEARIVRKLLDCSDACQMTANTMLRFSDFVARTCELCADFCEAAAVECERFDEEQMRECAAACRRCADACRSVRTAPGPAA